MISHEAIHESGVEFSMGATLQAPFQQYNGVRLQCSHEFNSVCLIWFWMLNKMTCPCCRFQENMEERASIANIAPAFWPAFEHRLDNIHAKEQADNMAQVELMAVEDWQGVSVVASIRVSFSPQMAVYLYGTDGAVYTNVVALHNSAPIISQPDSVTYSVQRNDLRTLSRYMHRDDINRLRIVFFLYDGFSTTVISQSPIMYTESGRERSQQQHENRLSLSDLSIPTFSILDDAPSVPLAVYIPGTAAPVGRVYIEHVDPGNIPGTLRPDGYNVVSSTSVENTTFTSILCACGDGGGDMVVHIEENTHTGDLLRISELRWVATDSEYRRVMERMQEA
jgi:hypothetical protein